MAEVPGWLRFIADVAKNIDEANRREFAAECRKEYEAGYEAARRRRGRRIKLIGEDSRMFNAWNAGYDAGSE